MKYRFETYLHDDYGHGQLNEYRQLVINPNDYIGLSFEDKKHLMIDLIKEHDLYWDDECLEDLLDDWGWLSACFVVRSPEVK